MSEQSSAARPPDADPLESRQPARGSDSVSKGSPERPARDAAEPEFAAENAPSPTDPANVSEDQLGGDENPQPPTRA
jgi:hypothetical protein